MALGKFVAKKKIQEKNDKTTVASLLKKDTGRFSNYQKIPEFVIEKIPELKKIDYCQRKIELDSPRYKWLRKHFQCNDFTAVEIGANLGYFSMTLAEEYNAKITVYESIPEYAKICQILCRIANLQDKIQVHDKSITIDDLKSIPFSDLMIHLNVLHHAGSSFDGEKIGSISDWHQYARQYLLKLSEKSSYLFFQTGNMWKNKPLFPSEIAVSFVAKLLENSNWEVKAIGVVEDLSKLQYTTFLPEKIDEIPQIYCRRNSKTKLVDYFLEDKVIGSLITGLAQRPIWFCRSR